MKSEKHFIFYYYFINKLYPFKEHELRLYCWKLNSKGHFIAVAAMQILQAAYLFTFPETLNPTIKQFQLQTASLFTFPKTLNPTIKHLQFQRSTLVPGNRTFSGSNVIVKSFSSDEFPVDESFREEYAPPDQETEDEARRQNWIERGWAPWEEIVTPEGDFAKKSLDEGEEVPLKTPEAIEAFKMLSPSYRKKKMEEMGLTEDEYHRKQFEIKGEIPEPLETFWAGPMVVRLVPPRDWPPRGWEVDREELAYIREAHKLLAVRLNMEDLEARVSTETDDMCLDRYKMFLKQYKEWVAANKDKLEEESYRV